MEGKISGEREGKECTLFGNEKGKGEEHSTAERGTEKGGSSQEEKKHYTHKGGCSWKEGKKGVRKKVTHRTKERGQRIKTPLGGRQSGGRGANDSLCKKERQRKTK